MSTSIRRQSVLRATTQNMYRDVRQPGYTCTRKKTGSRSNTPTNTTSHSNTAHMGVSHTHGMWAAALERWDLCMVSVMYLVYICLSCVFTAHESLGKKTDSINIYRYVRTK